MIIVAIIGTLLAGLFPLLFLPVLRRLDAAAKEAEAATLLKLQGQLREQLEDMVKNIGRQKEARLEPLPQ